MNQQERDIIAGLFDRLKSAEGQQRDPQVDAFIKERIAAQPGAVYAMLQSMYVSEQALTNMNGQMQQMQGEIQHLQQQVAQAQAPQQSGGFLSGLFGGSRPAAPPPPRPMGAPAMGMAPGQPGMGQPGPWGGQQPGMGQPGPWGGQQPGMGQPGPWGQQQPPQRQGGGFLATAATAAVGVAGGMLLANAISGMMNPASGQQSAASGSGEQTAAAQPPAAQDSFAGDQGMEDPDASYGSAYDDGGGYDDGGDY